VHIDILVKNSGAVMPFVANESEQILYAALRSGLRLPYECASGTCGTCKAKLIEGSVTNLWREASGNSFIRADKNEILMCQSSALTKCKLEIRSLGVQNCEEIFKPEYYSGIINRAGMLTNDVQLIEVKLDRLMNYSAGQFILLRAHGVEGFRAYSMVDRDKGSDVLELVIKRKHGGKLSNFLFQSDIEGNQLEIFGPLGRSTYSYERDHNSDLICAAGGTGIAGILAILFEASNDKFFDHHKALVCFGVNSEAELFFIDRLSALALKHSQNLRIVIALSNGDISSYLKNTYPELNFFKGFVHEALVIEDISKFQKPIGFLAGPPVAVEACTVVLIKSNIVEPNQIRFDRFG